MDFQQPAPQTNPESVNVWDSLFSICPDELKQDFKGRQIKGQQTYNTPLMTFNGRIAALDIFEELLDAAVYAEQYKLERKSLGDKVGVVWANSFQNSIFKWACGLRDELSQMYQDKSVISTLDTHYRVYDKAEPIKPVVIYPELKVKLEHPDAKMPTYAKEGDSGLDLYSIETVGLEAGEVKLIDIGISIELPLYTEAQIRPRSSLAIKYGVTVVNSPGTVDNGYRGIIKVGLINLGKEPFTVKAGHRIAQMVIADVKYVQPKLVTELSDSIRGTGGFGHTGI
jgi:dUTP pyrophosphatase